MTADTSTGRRYGGQSAEERRNQRRGLLVNAGRELLRSEGLAQVTVTGVCAKAGLTDRYFYESFTNRAAFLDTLFESATAERAARVFAQASLAGDDIQVRLRIVVDGTIQSLLDDFHHADLKSASADETLLRHRATLTRMAADYSTAYAHTILGPGVRDSPDFRMGALFVVAGAAELVIAWLTGALDMSRDHLIDKCARMITIAGTGFVAEMKPLASPSDARSTGDPVDEKRRSDVANNSSN